MKQQKNSETANSAKATACYPAVSEHILCKKPHLLRLLQCHTKCPSPSVKELILDPHPNPNQHQKLVAVRVSRKFKTTMFG